MTITVLPTEDQVFGALGQFMGQIMPAGFTTVRGQVNRVPPPAAANYAVMWPRSRLRLGTNFDEYVDCRFVASITGTVMDVTEVSYGALADELQVFGVDLTNPTTIIDQVSGITGGVGVYTVSPSQTISSRVMACGVASFLQPTEFKIQIDIHGPLAGDNAQRISTLFRDDYAVQFFDAAEVASISLAGLVAPLYADDPKQIPFILPSEQWEERYVVEACMQVQAVIRDVPQQFAEQVDVGLIEVDAYYPP